MASPLTVWSTTADGYVRGYSTDYATARTTGWSFDSGVNYGAVGQAFSSPSYTCYETFIDFNTSAIGSTAIVTVATLSLYGAGDNSTTDFLVNAHIYNWGSSLATADFRSGDGFGSYPKVAHYDTAEGWPTAYNVFVNDDFPANVSKTATTWLVLVSSRQVAANEPYAFEYVSASLAEYTGTDRDPKLYVEWIAGLPTLTTTAITEITSSTATSGGTITSEGDSAVTDYGVCWNTGGAPTIADSHTHDKP